LLRSTVPGLPALPPSPATRVGVADGCLVEVAARRSAKPLFPFLIIPPPCIMVGTSATTRAQSAGAPRRVTGPLARKHRFVEAIRQFHTGDRGELPYNELIQLCRKDLETALDTLEDAELARALCRLMRKHKISWTKAHVLLGKERRLEKDEREPGCLTMALAPEDWPVPVAEMPSLGGQSVTLCASREIAKKHLDDIPGHLPGNTHGMAIMHLGPPIDDVSPNSLPTELQIPLKLVTTGSTGPTKDYRHGTIYQFNPANVVHPLTIPTVIDLTETGVEWVKITVHEKDANLTLKTDFDSQFGGDAPVKTHTQRQDKNDDRSAKLQSRRKTDARKAIDADLSTLVSKLLTAKFPDITPRAPSRDSFGMARPEPPGGDPSEPSSPSTGQMLGRCSCQHQAPRASPST
jgi:hypothetical protein